MQWAVAHCTRRHTLCMGQRHGTQHMDAKVCMSARNSPCHVPQAIGQHGQPQNFTAVYGDTAKRQKIVPEQSWSQPHNLQSLPSCIYSHTKLWRVVKKALPAGSEAVAMLQAVQPKEAVEIIMQLCAGQGGLTW